MTDNRKPCLPNTPDISRRTAVKKMAILFAGVLSPQTFLAAAAGHTHAKDTPERIGQILNKNQYRLVQTIAELIIPKTNTPGASDADVHGFIDHQLAQCFTQSERDAFMQQLRLIDPAAKQHYQQLFIKCNNTQQTTMLENMELAKGGFSQKDKAFFKQFKALTLLGYYTSEIGATQELSYLPIPGGYIGDFPFEKIGKAWTL